MPFVQGKDIVALVALGEYHDRGVSQSQMKVGIALDDCSGKRDICSSERVKVVCAARYVLQHHELCRLPGNSTNQIVELGKDKRRQDATFGASKDTSHLSMVRVVPVVVGQ